MANTTESLTNVNLLSKSQYDEQSTPATDELWAVDIDTDSSFKEKVVGWGMPDFSSGVSKTNDIIYQAECDGWISIYGAGNASAAAFSLNVSYSSDMSNKTEVAASWVHASGYTSSAFVPVAKGLFYRATDISSDFRMTFFPCKGV